MFASLSSSSSLCAIFGGRGNTTNLRPRKSPNEKNCNHNVPRITILFINARSRRRIQNQLSKERKCFSFLRINILGRCDESSRDDDACDIVRLFRSHL
mmetsp:Transcript_19441/g.53481  ORF Transcript_19441/g.53481 Transcript_19441/m.53481 type:complete len:98 (+) Transcript_19441:479-772(+)